MQHAWSFGGVVEILCGIVIGCQQGRGNRGDAIEQDDGKRDDRGTVTQEAPPGILPGTARTQCRRRALQG